MKRMREAAVSLALVAAIVIIWCIIYGCTSLAAWNTPVNYGGDVTYGGDTAWVLANAQAFLNGEIAPVFQKFVKSLGAPFAANWNDYPITEELIFAAMGWLGRGIGLFASANVILLLAHVLAGLSFYWVARTLKYKTAFSLAGAVLFAFSPIIFYWSLRHITLAYYWHVPLFLLVTWWTLSGRITLWGRKWWIAAAVSFITGTFNPYYTCMYLQFLGFGVLLHSVRKQWPQAAMAFVMGCLAMAGFLLMNVDTISYAAQHGSNLEAGVRHLSELMPYALRVPDLLLPPPYHRWHWWASFGQTRYYLVTGLKGNLWSPYLGFAGIAGLAWLVGLSIFRLFQGKPRCIPVQAWQTLWVLAFSLVGGVNLILGILGCTYFRAPNRLSIIILCFSLLFLVRQLSRHCSRRLTLPVAFILLAVGLADQLQPVATSASIEQMAQQIRSDREFTTGMESGLPPGTMVFQLPVMGYPEYGSINKMYDYEHLIPYLYSKRIRYSYGSDKGRASESWQREVEKMPPAEMAAKLEEYGFGAIYLNTKAFKDGGSKLIDGLRDAGKPVLLVSSGKDLAAIRLKPAAVTSMPDIPPFCGPGWSVGGDPGDDRWAVAREATIEFWNTRKESTKTSIQFSLSTLKPRHVRITFNSELFDDFDLRPEASRTIGPRDLTLAPGKNVMQFETDAPPEAQGNADPRKLTFLIRDLKEVRFTTDSGLAKQTPSLPLDQRIEFAQGRSGTNYLLDGWSQPEPWGVWSDGPEASIKLPIDGDAKEIKAISLEADALVGPQHQEQTVDLWWDGEKIQSFCLKAFSDNLMEIRIPEAAQKTGVMRGYHLLRFSILNPAKPADIGMGPDSRNLGIGLKTLVLH